MNKPKQVKITVDKTGNTVIETEGYKGSSCDNVHDLFKSLGNTISSSPTSEMYETNIESIEITS
jgi:hypothetical protein